MSTKKLWLPLLVVSALWCATGCAVDSSDDPYAEEALDDEAVDIDEAEAVEDHAMPTIRADVVLDEPFAALSNEDPPEGGEEEGTDDGRDENPDPTPWTGREEDQREDENPDPTPYSASVSEPDPQPWNHNH